MLNDKLYHYSSMNHSLRIIEGLKLKFGNLKHTNDPKEMLEPNVDFISSINSSEKVSLQRLFENWIDSERKKYKLLCFVRDQKNLGYAKPRMWAQYAENHRGCCFVFDKEKLDSISISTKIYKRPVIYNDSLLTSLRFKESDDIHTWVKTNLVNLCFTKSKDWSGEKEFRYLVYDNSDKEIYLPIKSSLTDIFVSFNIETIILEKIIEMVTPDVVVHKLQWINGIAEIYQTYPSYNDYLSLVIEDSLKTLLLSLQNTNRKHQELSIPELIQNLYEQSDKEKISIFYSKYLETKKSNTPLLNIRKEIPVLYDNVLYG